MNMERRNNSKVASASMAISKEDLQEKLLEMKRLIEDQKQLQLTLKNKQSTQQ